MDKDALLNKFKSMGVQLGTQNLAKPAPSRRKPAFPIESVVEGTDHPTIFGDAFVTSQHYSLDYRHGKVTLCSEANCDVLSAWSQSARILQPGGENVVFLDTETSGLAGGTGTYVFLIGIGYRTAQGFDLVQFFMRDPAQEAALIAALDQWLARFDVVVTFNGKTFDIPLLTTRYQMNGLTPPFPSYEHVDVLHIARKLWRNRLPSRALGDLEKEIIQYNRTAEEVPGWLIPQLYFDYLRSGDARPLGGVFYHNAMDILSLSSLYAQVASILADPIHQEDLYSLDLAAVARLYEDLGWIERAAALYELSLNAGDLPEDFYLKTIDRFAHLRRRQGQWDSAVSLWQRAAERGQPSACVEISKYYEHRERNIAEALGWARKAMQSLDGARFFDDPGKTFERDLQRRIGRLYQRLYRDFEK